MFDGVRRWIVIGTMLVLPVAVDAAGISMSPSRQRVDLGEIASVDVSATGLSQQRVGAFDFWVIFDSGILQLLGVDFGPSLGNPFDDFVNISSPVNGRTNVAELSLLSDLSGLQSGDGDLLLFTLRFQTVKAGISALTLEENILGVAGGFLGDELGNPIDVSPISAASITVGDTGPTAPLPEPGSGSLLILAAAAALAASRRRPSKARR